MIRRLAPKRYVPVRARYRTRVVRIAAVHQLADDVWQLAGFPPNNRNVYILGEVLLDAGIAPDRARILRQVAHRTISLHALTHAHPDHYGASHAICAALGIPMWCGAGDVNAVEAGKAVIRGGRMLPAASAHPIDRALREGDHVAGFKILDTPREGDRALRRRRRAPTDLSNDMRRASIACRTSDASGR